MVKYWIIRVFRNETLHCLFASSTGPAADLGHFHPMAGQLVIGLYCPLISFTEDPF